MRGERRLLCFPAIVYRKPLCSSVRVWRPGQAGLHWHTAHHMYLICRPFM